MIVNLRDLVFECAAKEELTELLQRAPTVEELNAATDLLKKEVWEDLWNFKIVDK